MDYKDVLGASAVGVAIVSYVPYFRNLLAGRTKPHAFSWLVWAVLNGIAFAGQIQDKGGAGAWAIGFTMAVMLVIFALALRQGERNIRPVDWACLGGAAIALGLWFLTNGPLFSVVLITVIDALGFFPTVRKSYIKPHEETAVTFALSTLKYLLALLALARYTLVTTLFPVSLVLMNGLFVLMLLARRRIVARKPGENSYKLKSTGRTDAF